MLLIKAGRARERTERMNMHGEGMEAPGRESGNSVIIDKDPRP